MVIVTADRGLYANWLYYKIVQLKWHPYLRVNTGGFFQSELDQKWKALNEVVTEKGNSWCGQIRCFKKHSIQFINLIYSFYLENHLVPDQIQNPFLLAIDPKY